MDIRKLEIIGQQLKNNVPLATIAAIHRIKPEELEETLKQYEMEEEPEKPIPSIKKTEEVTDVPEPQEDHAETIVEPQKEDIKEEQLDKPAIAGESRTGRDDSGRFAKGFSGNPKGKLPGKISILADIKQRLLKMKEDEPERYLEMIDSYLRDDPKMQRHLLEMIDGRPRQQTIVESSDPPVPILVNFVDHSTCTKCGNVESKPHKQSNNQ